MAVHDPQTPEACLELDPPSLYLDFHKCLTMLSNPASNRGHQHADFTHLLAEYDAGYYSYLSAQVFAVDILEELADRPREHETWERYRSKILERGCAGSSETHPTKLSITAVL
jgi:metallopeptidase MepB